MTKLLHDVYWRCGKCGGSNRIRTVVADYEPTTYTCEHCGEASLVQAHDLAEQRGKVRIHRPHPTELDEPS